jgi:hypothetical protein
MCDGCDEFAGEANGSALNGAGSWFVLDGNVATERLLPDAVDCNGDKV